jgi:phenylacetic acid degradation operon negative regulatory protein
MTAPSAKSLILDLLSTVRRGAMPVRALIAAGELFHITENSVRVNLARLCRAQRVRRDRRGTYRLGRGASAVDQHLAGWRRADHRLGAWRIDRDGRGSWVAVCGLDPRGVTRHESQALRLLGMRELEVGLFVRPDNLTGDLARTREALYTLGLSRRRPVFRLDALDEQRERQARQLWRNDALREHYRDLQARLRESRARLPQLSRDASMAESFLLGGQAIRTIATDPLLPGPIVPEGEFAALVEATRCYDVVGRACWSEFLSRHQVIHLHSPVDLRIDDATRALVAPAMNRGNAA